MDYKFENTNIITCYIKELLKDFNLPMISVVTDESIQYKDRLYIKENSIVKYEGNNKYKKIHDYIYNEEIINLTKNFIINSSSYDTYTHRYLGEYLRFIKDFKGIDLMQFYNCFDNCNPNRIIYHYSDDSKSYLNIDTSDDRYSFYVVPVKFNKSYTIAIDSDVSYEISCILYNNNFIDLTPIRLRDISFKKILGSRFSQPYVYSTNELLEFKSTSTLTESEKNKYMKTCLDHEKDLYLLLKLPTVIKSSIVILEGDYTKSSNVIDRQFMTTLVRSEDASWDKDENGELINVVKGKIGTYYTKNSLLKSNDHVSYPFSNRLIEFLIENTIDSRDWNIGNVQRIQAKLNNEDPYSIDPSISDYSYKKYDGLWTDDLKSEIFKLMCSDINKDRLVSNYIIKDDRYKFISKYSRRYVDLYNDITGYVDKDTESILGVD